MASERVQRRIDRLLDQIERDVDQQNWERVRTLAVEVIAFAPDNVDAQAFLTAADRVLGTQTPPSVTEWRRQTTSTTKTFRHLGSSLAQPV